MSLLEGHRPTVLEALRSVSFQVSPGYGYLAMGWVQPERLSRAYWGLDCSLSVSPFGRRRGKRPISPRAGLCIYNISVILLLAIYLERWTG